MDISRKILHYLTLKAQTSDYLDKRVQYAINMGWQPYGIPYQMDANIYQAIVVYEPSTGYATPDIIKSFDPRT